MPPLDNPIEMDMQLHSSFAILNASPVPGVGNLTMHMHLDEVRELRDLCAETCLNATGQTEVVIKAGEVETGDILPGFGPITEAVPMSNLATIMLLFSQPEVSAVFPRDFQIAVNRRIS